MFALHDHLIHLAHEAVPRDVDAHAARALLKTDVTCRPPVDGIVYGTLLNDRATLASFGDALNDAPYKAPPKAPILYVKPRNTHAGHGAHVAVPQEGVQIGVSLGIVIGRTATRLSRDNALDFVAGYTAVADLSVPHASVYRPSVRFRARDNFCVMGPAVIARRHVDTPDALTVALRIDDETPFDATTGNTVRDVAQLLADVTDFMTLAPGDMLTLGVIHGSPVAHAGQRATLQIANWPALNLSLIAEETASNDPHGDRP